jgi:hypothetical protein
MINLVAEKRNSRAGSGDDWLKGATSSIHKSSMNDPFSYATPSIVINDDPGQERHTLDGSGDKLLIRDSLVK